jgi:hypothetical protein
MTDFAQITDAELVQQRRDPAFRLKLLVRHLEHLITALNVRRGADAGDGTMKRNRSGQA